MGTFRRIWPFLPEVGVLILAVWAQLQFRWWLLESAAARRTPWLRRALNLGAVLVIAWLLFGFLSSFPAAYTRLPNSWALYWVRGGALAWAVASIGACILLRFWRSVPKFNTERRGFLRATGNLVVAAPFATVGFGIIQRDNIRVREIDIPIPNLPKDLQGLRLVQLSDIHLSPFLSEKDLARAIEMANDLRAHLALVTGDLITAQGDPLDACLRQLARLRADAGVLGCLGNHEIYARAEAETTWKGARLGLTFLRQQARLLRFGDAALNVAGVDYQRRGRRYLVGAEKLLSPGAVNVLLSHNPDVFDVAARQGYDLTIAGHTHGGQVTVEILHQTLNVARFYTPYVYGLYRKGPSAIWVTRGIGTVGMPARIGAPPEVALLRLCAT
ncbi:MAG TPA: metallophosphoesterase [Bryobacteraceae bacterium]|nr:metallophosphoesterase [Bryobacteraceae bacterium]HOQ45829.1 metallophosphoesterase [Bryobacteraceae bacterium]HPQ14119.1 metallophosphoesterase [Bryobacteraceae bacterium]HPU70962.1 metallophosphoesterase [Bryobacteraceae bacterium]